MPRSGRKTPRPPYRLKKRDFEVDPSAIPARQTPVETFLFFVIRPAATGAQLAIDRSQKLHLTGVDDNMSRGLSSQQLGDPPTGQRRQRQQAAAEGSRHVVTVRRERRADDQFLVIQFFDTRIHGRNQRDSFTPPLFHQPGLVRKICRPARDVITHGAGFCHRAVAQANDGGLVFVALATYT